MTEETQQAIDEALEVETPEVADNDAEQPKEVEQEAYAESETDDGSVEFPKKAVNALNRKNKQINKLRAQMRELEAKLKETPEVKPKEVKEEDFENYSDYILAQAEALVENKTQQSQSDLQKQQLEQQKQALMAQRNQYIIEQAHEFSKTFPDLPQVWQQNAQLLDALPQEIADVFYSIENAPAAIYTLVKEGKLESLMYANPAVAAYEIVNAQNKGLEMISRPKNQVSQAPTPISKAKGTGSLKKQLSPNDDVLRSLGLKK